MVGGGGEGGVETEIKRVSVCVVKKEHVKSSPRNSLLQKENVGATRKQ